MNAKLMQSLARAVILPTILAISLSGCSTTAMKFIDSLASITYSGPGGKGWGVGKQPEGPSDLPKGFLECVKVEPNEVCRERFDLASSYTCSGTMDPRAYAYCVRCASPRARDEAECRRLTEIVVTYGGPFSTPLVVTGQPFAGDGTADPAGHPPIGPLPPLNDGADVRPVPATP